MFYISLQCVYAFPIARDAYRLLRSLTVFHHFQTMSGNLTELRANTQVFSPFFF